jgi:hypothetical protein
MVVNSLPGREPPGCLVKRNGQDSARSVFTKRNRTGLLAGKRRHHRRCGYPSTAHFGRAFPSGKDHNTSTMLTCSLPVFRETLFLETYDP